MIHLELDENMTERTYFEDSTGGPISGLCSTYEITFQPKDIDSIGVTNTSERTSDGDSR